MRSGFTLVELLVVISIIVVLAGLSTPVAMKALGEAQRVTAISNVGNIAKAMNLFANDFDGEFPSDDTGTELLDIKDDNIGGGADRSLGGGGSLSGGRLERRGGLGDRNDAGSVTSNNSAEFYFDQLMDRGLDDEKLFYLKAFKKAFILNKPNEDGRVDPGENVWAYTKGLQQTSGTSLPIIYDNPVSTGDNPTFSKRVWDGKIIVARLDNSVGTENIRGSDPKSGRVVGKVDGENLNLFSPNALQEGTLVAAELRQINSGN